MDGSVVRTEAEGQRSIRIDLNMGGPIPGGRTGVESQSEIDTKCNLQHFNFGYHALHASKHCGNFMPNRPLINPTTNTLLFGRVPDIAKRGVNLPGGAIHLLRGKHTAPNRGFGACHIWAEHSREMIDEGFTNEAAVPAYVAFVITAASQLYYSGESFRYSRLMAVRGIAWTAILELRDRDEPFWSVITAYRSNKKHGTFVGSVLL